MIFLYIFPLSGVHTGARHTNLLGALRNIDIASLASDVANVPPFYFEKMKLWMKEAKNGDVVNFDGGWLIALDEINYVDIPAHNNNILSSRLTIQEGLEDGEEN